MGGEMEEEEEEGGLKVSQEGRQLSLEACFVVVLHNL